MNAEFVLFFIKKATCKITQVAFFIIHKYVFFLKTDTFAIEATKPRKTAIIQFSSYAPDNDLQLQTHIHESAFIGSVRVDISVEGHGDVAVTENG